MIFRAAVHLVGPLLSIILFCLSRDMFGWHKKNKSSNVGLFSLQVTGFLNRMRRLNGVFQRILVVYQLLEPYRMRVHINLSSHIQVFLRHFFDYNL